jgi:hypothetical protein
MKKGRKHDSRNRGKGDYKIAGEKMFVRLIQGEAMVRHQGIHCVILTHTLAMIFIGGLIDT